MTVQPTPQFLPAETEVEPICLLDETGKLRDGAEPGLSEQETLDGLRYMMLGRAFDTKCFSLNRQGKVGTFAPIVGQEASILGPALALDPARDWVVPQYRELPAVLRQGFPLEQVAMQRRGHPAGARIPEGVNVLGQQVSLAVQLPHAVGIAWGLKLQGKDGVVIVYFGEGSSSEGDFHESCNLAGVLKAPVIFLLQNNAWAISTPREIQSATVDLAARAPGYGFPGVSVDGNDLLAMHLVTRQAVDRARAGDGPTLIEAHTFRMWAHTTADDPTRYVEPSDLERWRKRDPIERIQKYLADRGQWDEALALTWEAEIAAEVEAAFAKVDPLAPPTAADIYEHVYAEMPPTLARQRAAQLGAD